MNRTSSGGRQPQSNEESRSESIDADLGSFPNWGPHFSTASAILVVVGMVAVAWVSGTASSHSLEHLMLVMREFAGMISGAGWAMIGTAISLVAVAVTAVTVIGLRDPDNESNRRRKLIMSVADTFIIGALGLLMGCILLSGIGFLGLNSGVGDLDALRETVGVLSAFAAALVLWICVRGAYGHLRGIALTDRDALRNEKTSVHSQKKLYEDLVEKTRSTLQQLGVNPQDSALRRAGKSAIASILLIVAAALLATAITVSIGFSEGAPVVGAVSRSARVFIGVSLLASIQMIFAVVPYLWSMQFLGVGEERLRRWSKLAASIIFTTPMFLLVPLSVIGGFVALGAEVDIVIMLVLCVVIFGPSMAMLMIPGRWSWRTVSTVIAYKQVQGLLSPLVQKAKDLDLEDSTNRVWTQDKASQEIHDLLSKLIEIEVPKIVDGVAGLVAAKQERQRIAKRFNVQALLLSVMRRSPMD